MYYEIYVDSFLLQEISINFYVLLLCRLCLMRTATCRRLFLSAVTESVLQLFLILIPYPHNKVLFYGMFFVLHILKSYITVTMAFGKNKMVKTLHYLGIYMAILLMVGGCVFGILPRMTFYQNSRIKPILLILTGAFLYVAFSYTFLRKVQNTYYGNLKLFHQGMILEGTYFLDSGNGLMESISGKPVLLADEKWLEDFLKQGQFMCRPVIYKSVGKSRGILYAYCVDKLVIWDEKKAYTYDKVWVGVCEKTLLEQQKCQVILPLCYGQK